MSEGQAIDPRALRWVEAGVSGLARQRDWDSVEVVEAPELADLSLEQFRFGRLGDGVVVPDGAEPVPHAVLERLADRVERSVGVPFEALAARQTRLEWSLAARRLRIEEIVLPPVDAGEIVVAIGPDGGPTLLVDGDEPPVRTPELDHVAAALVELGRRRHESFVVRARRTVGDRWALTIDPL